MNAKSVNDGNEKKNLDLIRFGGVQFQVWLDSLGVSRSEGYLWRKRGWVKVCRIGKTLYILQEEIDRFWSRVRNQEFEGKLAGCCAAAA
jgi:hypothetical protein